MALPDHRRRRGPCRPMRWATVVRCPLHELVSAQTPTVPTSVDKGPRVRGKHTPCAGVAVKPAAWLCWGLLEDQEVRGFGLSSLSGGIRRHGHLSRPLLPAHEAATPRTR